MSYVKSPFGVTDYSAGFQSVNGLSDNFVALYDAWALEHSSREPQFNRAGVLVYPSSAQTFGRHDTPKVPRAVVKTDLYGSTYTVTFPGSPTVAPVITGLSRLSTGLVWIGVTDLNEFYAEVEPVQSAAATCRIVIPRTSIGGRGAPVGLTVECYELSGTAFALTDFDFNATVYGTTT